MHSKTKVVRGLAVWALALSAACGGGSSSTPTSPAPIPAADACAALGSTTNSAVAVLNGAACSVDRTPVVKLNLKGSGGSSVGLCSATIVTPRVVLTAAHCLDEDVAAVRVWLGTGPEFDAQRFEFYPNYRFNDASSFDVGLVFMSEDLPRTPVPILTSRVARVGEAAIIAGFGRNLTSDDTTILRAGSTNISAVGRYLETLFAPPSSSVCSGDSGGPILLSEGGRWTIGGITSATSSAFCNEGTNLYQAISHPSVLGFILARVPAIGQR